MSARFIIEGEWIGYRSSQDRIVHRQVYPASRKTLRAWAEKTHCIRYTDGTSLVLSVRDCKPRERVSERRGYTKLIDECAYHDVCSVDALQAAEAEARKRMDAAWSGLATSDMERLHDALEGASVWMGNHLLHLEEKARRYNPYTSDDYIEAMDREIADLRRDIAQINALREQVFRLINSDRQG